MSEFDFDTDIVLDAKNFKVTDEQKSIAVWLLKKYTSYAWLDRTREFLACFITEFEKVVARRNTELFRGVLSGHLYRLSQYEKGLEEIKSGKLTKGFDTIYRASEIYRETEEPRADMFHNFIEIGYREPPKQSVGIYSLLSKAIMMGKRNHQALGSENCAPQMVFDAVLPEDIEFRIEPLTTFFTETTKTDDDVPVTGIWLPTSHPHACPVYMDRSYKAHSAVIPTSERKVWNSEEEYKKGIPPKEVSYYHEEIPSKFILLWKEDRYRLGRVTDEPEFLDPTVELPETVPVTPPVKEEDYF